MRKKAAFAALGLGAAYLMRNKGSREKLSKQFDEFGGTSKHGKKTDTFSESRSSQTTGRKKGLLQNIFN